MAGTPTSQQDPSLDSKCRGKLLDSRSRLQRSTLPNILFSETIDRTFPFFVIHNNHVTILPNTTLFSITSQVFTTAIAVFALPAESQAVLATEPSLKKLLAAIFDAEHRAFVLEDSDRILAVLDEDAKACILAQAIAGIVFVLRRLVGLHGGELTTAAFERQLRLFAGSEQRRTILDRVERSHLWGNCFAKPEILNMIMDAINVDMEQDSGRSSPVLKLEDDLLDPVAWVNEHHPTRNLGVPEGLTIMALN